MNDIKKELKDAFDKWFYEFYSDECISKDAYIKFQERNTDRILDDLSEVIF